MENKKIRLDIKINAFIAVVSVLCPLLMSGIAVQVADVGLMYRYGPLVGELLSVGVGTFLIYIICNIVFWIVQAVLKKKFGISIKTNLIISLIGIPLSFASSLWCLGVAFGG